VNVPESPGYDTWLELERSRLGRLWRRAALHEVARLETVDAWQRAAELTTALTAADPLDEEALHAHMRVLAALGRHGEVRSAYAELVRVLAAELCAEPLEVTTELFHALTAATLAAPAAAGEVLRARPPANHNLPLQTTRFVGRQREVEALAALLGHDDTRLVTITGLGGVGKSRLSLEVAARRLPEHAEGVWFVELAGVMLAEALPTTIATALRLDLAAAATRGATAALVDHVRDKHLLLVLDNFEHLVTAAPLLEELLEAAPGLKILVSSRVTLALRAETIFELDGLGVPPPGTTADLAGFDAVRLFVDRAERLSSAFVATGQTLAAVAELTRRVEGMPLALELAATWTRSLSVPELVAALDGSLDLLSASLRDLPERHRSIRTVLDYSWSRLTTVEKRSLERLSVFRGGFTRAAADAVTGVHLALLLGLVSHSLVARTRDGRFHLHELVRLFATERLLAAAMSAGAASGAAGAEPGHASPAALREAASRYYLALLTGQDAVLRTPRRAAVLDGLFEDFDNIRLAFANACERLDEEQLSAALPSLFALYLEAGALAEIIDHLEGLAGAVGARGTDQARLGSVVTQQLARAHMSRGDFATARAELEPLVERLRAAPDNERDALPRVLDWLGSCARIGGDLDAAQRYLDEALSSAEGVPGDSGERLLADVTYNLASLRQAQGRNDEALALLEHSLASSLKSRDDVGAAVRRLALAKVLAVSGSDLAAARLHLEEAMAIARAARATRLEGGALNALAVLAGQQDDKAAAERYNLESLALARRQGQLDDQRTALANLGGIVNGQGRLDEAAVYLQRALELAQRTGNPAGLNQTYSLLGENCSLRGDHSGAKAYFRAGLSTEVLAGTPPFGQAQCLSLLANVLEREGRADEARGLRLELRAHAATPPGLRRRLAQKLGASGGDAEPTDAGTAGGAGRSLAELAAAVYPLVS